MDRGPKVGLYVCLIVVVLYSRVGTCCRWVGADTRVTLVSRHQPALNGTTAGV